MLEIASILLIGMGLIIYLSSDNKPVIYSKNSLENMEAYYKGTRCK